MTTDPSTWNIVVTDDDPDSIRLVECILGFSGARVRAAECGAVCLDLIRQERPTFLLLDIQMPRMSGWEVLQEIRKDDSLRDLFVVAVTAHAMIGDRERVLGAGFNAYIPKPINPLTFVDEVGYFLETSSVVRSP
jgi:two-component system cell cycle response regulator